MKKIIIALAVGIIIIGGTIYTQVSKTETPLVKSTSPTQSSSLKNNTSKTKTTNIENINISKHIRSPKFSNQNTIPNRINNIQNTNNHIQTNKKQATTINSLKLSANTNNSYINNINQNNNNINNNATQNQNTSNKTPQNTNLCESKAIFNNNSSGSNLIFSTLQKSNKKNMSTASIVVNTNDYKIINGTKYYNVYEYLLKKSSKDWSSNGNYSKSIGALYMNENGKILSNQYIQNFNELSVAQKKEQIMLVAKEFISYFNYNGPITINMNKSVTFEGYTCYLVTFGDNTFYISPAGFVYISKNQKFY